MIFKILIFMSTFLIVRKLIIYYLSKSLMKKFLNNSSFYFCRENDPPNKE